MSPPEERMDCFATLAMTRKSRAQSTKLPDGQIADSDFRKSCQAQNLKESKIFRFFRNEIDGIPIAIPSRSEGRFMIVTNVGRVAVDAEVMKANVTEAYGKDVWS
jgi:hypothetical protein